MGKIIFKFKYKILFLSLIILALTLCSLPIPYMSKFLVDDIFIQKQLNLLAKFSFFFLLIFVLQVTLTRLVALISTNLSKNMVLDIKYILSILLNQNYFNNIKDVSFIQNVLLNEIDTFVDSLLEVLENLLSNSVSIIGISIIIFTINTWLATISVMFIPLYFIVSNMKKDSIIRKSKLYEESKDYNIDIIQNVLNNNESIQIYGLERNAQIILDNSYKEKANAKRSFMLESNLFSVITTTLVNGSSIIPLIIGGYFVENNLITIGELIAFSGYISMLFLPTINIIKLFPQVQTLKTHVLRYELLLEKLSRNSSEKNLEIISPLKTIELVNLNVKYNKKIFTNANLKLFSGNTYHLKGLNGTGKTTFLKCISGLVQDYSGNIYYDNLNIKNIKKQSFQKKVIYVNNEQSFLYDNFFQNIIGNHDYSRDLLLKLVSILYIDYLFKNINSRVNSTDVFNFEVLSNGEVQKLRLLRALIREPQLLLLDEAFSMINREEAIAILVSIRKIFPKMLIVFVEHHLEVDCKEIIIKDNNLSISF